MHAWNDPSHRVITDLGQSEDAVGFSALFEITPFGIVFQRADGSIISANPAAERILGLSLDQMKGRTSIDPRWKAIHEDGTPFPGETHPAMAALATGQGRQNVTMGVFHPMDESIHWIQISATPLFQPGAARPDRVMATFVDITDRMRAEQALKESEERYCRFFTQGPEGLVVLNPVTKRPLEFNDQVCRQLGYTRDEFRRLTIADIEAVESAEETARRFQQVMAEGSADFETLQRTKQGELRNIHVTAQYTHGSKGSSYHCVWRDITERKQMQLALQESEERFRQISLAMTDIAYSCIQRSGEAFAIDWMIGATEALLGRTLEEVKAARCWGNFLEKEDLPRFMKQVLGLAPGEAGVCELRLRKKDGGLTWVRSYAQNKAAVEGEAHHRLFGALVDITGQKKAEAALQESEERLRLATEASRDGIWDWNVAAGEVLYNPSYTRMLGYELQEFEAEVASWEKLICPEDRARVVAVNEGCIQGVYETFEVEFRMMARDGTTKWILGRGKAVSRDDQGRARRIVGTHHDVTEKKLAEDQLRASEERFRALVQHSWDILSLLDAEGRLIYNSPACERIHGFTVEELLGRSTVDLVHPEDAPQVAGKLEWLLAHPGEPASVEYRYACKDGHWVWMEAVGVNHLDNPDIQGIVVSSRDLSDRKRADLEMAELQTQLQQAQKMESLGTLSGGIAHDMNNVLGAILGLASANIEIQPPGSPTFRSFETIVKAATRGGEMVRSLLAFARQGQAEDRVLDVNALLREETHLLERTTLAKVRIELDLAPGLRPMRGDAGALTHAFMNLCINAVDAMPDNGRLTLRTRNVDSDWIEVAVEDSGSGMPKEVLDRAMEPFFTTKEVGKGTGLGLSLVYSTVKAHKGQIDIQSRPGQGTCVRLRFPACQPANPAAESRPEPASLATSRVLKVLLVDDDELIQSSMGTILQTLGHAVAISPSGEQALAKIEAGFKPDVVILDMNMPGLGGLGTLPRLRAMLPNVPVLLSTGRTDQGALDLAKAHPLVTLLPKPFAIKELQQTLEALGRP
jgi:PAS domain S-box-containing protein